MVAKFDENGCHSWCHADSETRMLIESNFGPIPDRSMNNELWIVWMDRRREWLQLASGILVRSYLFCPKNDLGVGVAHREGGHSKGRGGGEEAREKSGHLRSGRSNFKRKFQPNRPPGVGSVNSRDRHILLCTRLV